MVSLVLHKTPHDIQAFVPAATQLKSAGQREAALTKYQQAVDICPAYADGFYDLGVYYSEDSQVGYACIITSSFKLHCIFSSVSWHPSYAALRNKDAN